MTLWGIAAFFAVLVNWFVTLFRGRPSAPLHRFVAALLRYQAHVYAYAQLVANPFPGFVGRRGSYPIDLELPGPERQRRLITGFRFFLAIPAFFIAGALGTVAVIAAIFSWFYALARGRVPRGLRNVGALSLRYGAQATGYLVLVTDRYPYSGPTAGWQPRLAPTAPQEA
jgi:hypothetical protein